MARRGSGEGNIYRRADGLWVGRVSLGYTAGKRRRKVITARLDARPQTASQWSCGQFNRAAHPFGATHVASHLLRWVAGARTSVRASRWRRYEELTRLHLVPRLGSDGLSKLSPAGVSAALAGMLEGGVPRERSATRASSSDGHSARPKRPGPSRGTSRGSHDHRASLTRRCGRSTRRRCRRCYSRPRTIGCALCSCSRSPPGHGRASC